MWVPIIICISFGLLSFEAEQSHSYSILQISVCIEIFWINQLCSILGNCSLLFFNSSAVIISAPDQSWHLVIIYSPLTDLFDCWCFFLYLSPYSRFWTQLPELYAIINNSSLICSAYFSIHFKIKTSLVSQKMYSYRLLSLIRFVRKFTRFLVQYLWNHKNYII